MSAEAINVRVWQQRMRKDVADIVVRKLQECGGVWFAVEPWPEDIVVVQVKPENSSLLQGYIESAMQDSSQTNHQTKPPEGRSESNHTPNGYDPLWVKAINNVLEDRESDVRIDDIDEAVWDEYIGPLVDSFDDDVWDEEE